MIASKQIAFGKAAGGNKLPDGVVPIEYLESTGTQYIDTGVVVDTTTIWRVNCAVTDTATQFMGVIDENTMRYHLSFYDLGVIKGCMGAMQSNIGTPNMEFNEYELNCTTKTASMNGISAECDYTKNAGKIPSLSIWLFGRNSDRDSYQRMINIKVGMSKIWKADTLIRDLIPVRKGNIGYMYDRVSGQLFGNQGTGEFVLGHDVVEPLPVDFVQDGLQVCFDGRVGLDVENGSWKELVSGITYSADMVNTNNNEVFTGASRLLTPIRLPFDWSDGITLQYTVDTRGGSWNNKNPIFAADGDTTSLALTVMNEGTATDFMYDSVIDKNSPYDGDIRNVQATLVYKDGVAKKYIGGVYKRERSITMLTTPSEVVLDACPNKVFLYSALAYNRALTAEEIAHNYSIDKARFGL